MTTEIRTKRTLRSTLLLVAAATVLVVLHVTRVSPVDLWSRTFLNSLHVMVFAIVALLVFAATSVFQRLGATQRIALTLVASLALGAISELAQLSGPRDASLGDLLLDFLGASGALLLYAGLHPSLLGVRNTRITFSIAGVFILVGALFPLLTISAAYVERNASRPTLISFNSPFVRTFVRPQNAVLSIDKSLSSSETVGRVLLLDGAWPGLVIHDIWPDWQSYSTLVVDVSLPGFVSLDLHIRVHDRAHRVGEQPYSDRFNLKHTLLPGPNTLRIPLEKIKTAPQGRSMDLERIDGIVIFATASDAGREFVIHRIRLE